MKRFTLRTLAVCAALGALSLGSLRLGLPAAAQSRPLPQRQLSRGATSAVRSTPEPRATHLVYGTLSAVHGAALLLRTRHATSLRVNAAAAIASGTYSAPLFVGKVVAVGGYYDAAGVLQAQSVMRLTKLDPTTGADR